MTRTVYVYNAHYAKGASRYGGLTLSSGCVNSPLTYLTIQTAHYCAHVATARNVAACKALALRQHKTCADQGDKFCATCEEWSSGAR
jgi:hypothetical protein